MLSFSVFVCSADKMTTSAQNITSDAPTTSSSNGTTEVTTQPGTTSSSNGTTSSVNTTSEAPTTAPPTTPATTPTPLPAKSRYQVMDGKNACLILEGSFQLEVNVRHCYTYSDNFFVISLKRYCLFDFEPQHWSNAVIEYGISSNCNVKSPLKYKVESFYETQNNSYSMKPSH